MTKTFRVLSYKDSAGFFERDGVVREIHCDHYREQDLGMNNVGEVVPLPTSSAPPLLTGTDFQHATVMIPQTAENPSPTGSGDANFVAVTKIKDRVTLVTTYVDTAAYNTAVEACNECGCVPVCPSINPDSLAFVDNENGTVTASWDPVVGVSGYEYLLEVQDVKCFDTPTGTGYTFTESTSIVLPVDIGTTYCLFVRGACANGVKGLWYNIEITSICEVPSGITQTDRTSNSATFDWDIVPSGTEYQYSVTAANVDPGIFFVGIDGNSGVITVTTVTQTGLNLMPSTQYYFQLRRSCGGGHFSPWEVTPFTTAA